MESMNHWDGESARKEFLAFEDADFKKWAYLDSAATGQKLKACAIAEWNWSARGQANPNRGAHELAARAVEKMESARKETADWIGGDPRGVVFTSGATESINLLARAAESEIEEGEALCASALEHHANYLPWQESARKRGAEFHELRAQKNGELDVSAALAWIERRRPKWVALSAMSNVTSEVMNLREIIGQVKQSNPRARVVIDAAQAIAHMQVPSDWWGGDALVFSAHKMHGPLGLGVLAAKPALLDELDPGKQGGGMIRGFTEQGTPRWAKGHAKWEAGSPNGAAVEGWGATLSVWKSWDTDALWKSQERMARWLEAELSKIDGVRVLGSEQHRHGLVSFVASWAHAHDIGTELDARKVAIRVGHHCALPLMRSMELDACSRISLSAHVIQEDLDRVIEGVRAARRRFA